MAKFSSIETMTPEDVEGKVLIVKSGDRYVNAELVTRELRKVFPNLVAHQILIMPDDWKLLSIPRGELVAQLKGWLRRFQVAGDI